MSHRPGEGALILLDACCVINLFATERAGDILVQLPYRFAVSKLVADEEVLSIRHVADPDGSVERERVSPRSLEEMDDLTVMDIATPEEQDRYARFAIDLDDGEASACALAVVHGGGVATDDKKALRVLEKVSPRVPTLQTPDLLFEWALLSNTPEAEVRRMLRAVRDRARFFPRRVAPHFSWWAGFFR
ncbi:MAG: hypothetical protein GY719_10240 [bacterium]|nr:hypothetical protein [bacterium]